ncbi:MAG: LysE family translocator [Pseudohongiellaceae bacterium]
MPPLENLIAFTLAALLMNLSPGPSNLYVMARTVSQGTSGGLAAVAGLAVGSLVHVAATVLGLAALLTYFPIAYTVIKIAGAFYLIYLGLNYFFSSADAALEDTTLKSVSTKKVFRESVIVEVTNPKTALFFLALLPQFVAPELGNVGLQLLVLGLIVTASAIPCDLIVTFFANRARAWLQTNPNAQIIQNRVSGSILTGLGVYILAAENT